MLVAYSVVRLIDVCIALMYNETFLNLCLVDWEWMDYELI